MRFPRPLLALLALLCLLGAGRSAAAHPISQGALDVTISADAIAVEARVPVEEAFVAGALGSGSAGSPPPGDIWKEHGQYFLRHFEIVADGRILTGVVSSMIEPDANRSGFVVYELR